MGFFIILLPVCVAWGPLSAAWNHSSTLSDGGHAGVAVGRGTNHPTDNFVYGGFGGDATNGGPLREFSWNGSSFTSRAVETSAAPLLSNPVIGNGRNDGGGATHRLYAVIDKGSGGLSVFEFSGAGYSSTTVASLTGDASGPTAAYLILGDGRGDGTNRLYVSYNTDASGGDSISGAVAEFTWNGAVWVSTLNIVTTGGTFGPLAIGDGRNNFTNSLYYYSRPGGSTKDVLTEATFSGGNWGSTVPISGDSVSHLLGPASCLGWSGNTGIFVYDGRGDGTNRVYTGRTEATWTGVEWQFSEVVTQSMKSSTGQNSCSPTDQIVGLGSALTDGTTRLYAFGSLGETQTLDASSSLVQPLVLSEWSYSGTTWSQTDSVLSMEPLTTFDSNTLNKAIALGQGQNDGVIRVYQSFASPSIDNSLAAVNLTNEGAGIVELSFTTTTAVSRFFENNEPPAAMRVDLVNGQTAEIRFPADVFASSAMITMTALSTFTADGNGLQGTGLGFKVDGSTVVFTNKPAIRFYYGTALPQTFFPGDLVVARLNSSNRWWAVPGTLTRNFTRRTITGQTDQFSEFQLMKGAASAASGSPNEAFGYPSPFSRSQHSQMQFARISAGKKIRIYTVAGLFVRELTANSNGVANWDGKDSSGGQIAPGTYLAAVEGDKPFTIMVMP